MLLAALNGKLHVFLLYSQSFLAHGVLFLLEMLFSWLERCCYWFLSGFLFLVPLSSCCLHFQNDLCFLLLFVLFLASFFSYSGFRLPDLLLESQLVSLTSVFRVSSSQLHCQHQTQHMQRPLSPPHYLHCSSFSLCCTYLWPCWFHFQFRNICPFCAR